MKQSSLSPARLAAMAARPRKSSGFTISCGLASLGLLSPPLTAGHIIFVGTEVGGLVDSPVDANDYLVENWSNTAVPKTYDADGNNFYGSDGYYQITPSAIGTDNAVLEVGEGNDLGVTLDTTVLPEGQYPTQYLLPAFLAANPTGAAGTYYNLDTAPEYSNPAGDGLIRQGSLSVSINNFGGTVPGLVPIPGNWNNAFTFTLDEAASFRLGVAVDTLGYSDYAPDYVSVSNVNTGEVFSTSLTRYGVSNMVFFDIKGSAGDEFAVNLWQTNTEMNTTGPVAFGLITFDRIPVPILSYARDGGNFILSWQPQITGWTLESSTDLAPDSWTPVTGVANNSVSVPMTGVPKKFFRLKEIP